MLYCCTLHFSLTLVFSALLPFFFFNDTATTEIYTLSLHDALPISLYRAAPGRRQLHVRRAQRAVRDEERSGRSEEHTSELQSHSDLVCRLLLEKKKMEMTNEKKMIDVIINMKVSNPGTDAKDADKL